MNLLRCDECCMENLFDLLDRFRLSSGEDS